MDSANADPEQDNLFVRVMLARFETKLDLVLGQHRTELTDHETRLRVVEERKSVTPAQMLATSVGIVAVLGGGMTILDRLYA